MRVISSVAVLLFMHAIAGPALTQRLPQTTTPDNYDLVITPNLAEASFRRGRNDPRHDSSLDRRHYVAAEIAFDRVTITQEGREQTASVGLNGASEQATFTSRSRFNPVRPPSTSLTRGYSTTSCGACI